MASVEIRLHRRAVINQVVERQYRESSRVARLLPGIGAATSTVGVLFDGLDSTAGKAVACLLMALLLGFALVAAPPTNRFWRAMGTPIGIFAAGIVWACMASLTSVGQALSPDLMLPEALGLAAMPLALTAGAIIGAEATRQRQSVDGVMVLGAAAAGIGLIAGQADFTPSETMWQVGEHARFAGTLGNANVAGTFYAAVAVLAFGRLAQAIQLERARSLATLFVAGSCCFVALSACVATASRTAALSMFIAMGLTCISFSRRSRASATRWLPLIGLIAIVSFTALCSGRLSERTLDILHDWQTREMMWTHYGAIALREPLTGYGLGSFPLLNVMNLGTASEAQALSGVNAAHNFLLQLALTGGVPLAVAVAIAVLLVMTGIGPRRESRSDNLNVPLLLALFVVLINAMVDIALDVPAIATIFFFLLGLVAGSDLSERRLLSWRATSA